jgi:vesicle coat complex subunit
MTETRIHRRTQNNRKNVVPLSKLRTSDVVRTVLDNPRRLEELVNMLEDKDRCIRGRASMTVARISETHPGRLTRILPRLKDCLTDDSAYVRWNIVYALGQLGFRCSSHAKDILENIIAALEDGNRIVRVMAIKALALFSINQPLFIEESFRNLKKEIPSAVSRFLPRSPKQVTPKHSRS